MRREFSNVIYFALAVAAMAIFCGCNSTNNGPTSQPTVAGVSAADLLAKTYTTTANLEKAYAASGKLTPAQATTAAQADNAAYAAVQAADTSALSGASALQGAAATALAAFEDAVNNPK